MVGIILLTPILLLCYSLNMDDSTDDKPHHDAPERDDRRDLAHYTMTPDQAAEDFATGGIPVSLRSVQRYCQTGKLDCVRIDPDTRELTSKKNYDYMIDPNSIPKRLEQLREKADFKSTSSGVRPHEVSRHDAPGQVMSRQGAPLPEGRGGEYLGQIAELEAEKRKLEIDVASRQHLIERADKDREVLLGQLETFVDKFTKQITDQAIKIGRLETQLQQIEAPKKPEQSPEEVPEGGEGGDNLFSENQDQDV